MYNVLPRWTHVMSKKDDCPCVLSKEMYRRWRGWSGKRRPVSMEASSVTPTEFYYHRSQYIPSPSLFLHDGSSTIFLKFTSEWDITITVMNYFLSLQNGAGSIWCNQVHSSCHQHSNSSDRHVPAIKIQGFSYFSQTVGNTVRHLDIRERTVHCQTPSHRLRLPPSESQSKVSFDMDLNDLHLIPYPRPCFAMQT